MKTMTWLVDIGIGDYKKVWELQKRLVERRAGESIQDVLLLVEHPEVITLGKRGKQEDIFTDDIPVFEVERGGEATYHGPGQLVGYPIFSIKDWPSGVMSIVRMLEDVLIDSASDVGVKAGRIPNQTGVWAENKKIASIGLAVRNGVTYHGFAINVNTNLSRFRLLRPCGFDSSVMTSLNSLIGGEVNMPEFKKKLLKHFQQIFDVTLEPIDLSKVDAPQHD